MIFKVFTVKDKALDNYSGPFTQSTIEAGLRMWREIVMFGPADNRYKRSPEDFTLYMVGEFDDETATFTDTVNVRIASAKEVLIDTTTKEE